MNLVLVGFMASGKPSVGRRVARRLGYHFLDADQFIEIELGVSISEIFEISGEDYFRDVESKLLERLRPLEHHVFSTGGGVLTSAGNLERLKTLGTVVFLKADPEEILQRLSNDSRRPMVKGGDLRETVSTLLDERMPMYLQADVVIETAGKSPNQVAGEVIRRGAAFRRDEPPSATPDGENQSAGAG